MATKTITINVEAYERLKSVKREDESFSQTINRVVRKPLNADRLLTKLRKLSPETLDGAAEQVSSRTGTSRRGK